jgi:hypothetical protein
MKTFTFSLALKCLLPLFFICSVYGKILAQTFIHVEPVQVSEIIAERYLNFGGSSNAEAIVSDVDSVLWSGKTIGYVVHFKTGSIAVIPKVREINPLFALSAGNPGETTDAKQVETFFKEELERRYLSIVHKRISAVSVQRNERMWQQVLLADISN